MGELWRIGVLAAGAMDAIDWCVFAVATVAIPLSLWLNFRWWRKTRAGELPKDWQSFGMITVGLVCMIAIVCWFLFKFILPGRN